MKSFWKDDLMSAPYGEIKRNSVLLLAWNATEWLKSVSAPMGVALSLSSADVTVDERLEVQAQTVVGNKIVARIIVKEDGGATVGAFMPLAVIVVASDGQRKQFDFFLNLVDTSAMPCVC